MKNRRALRPKKKFSGYRLAQTCWIITSVFFALLIGEITKESLLVSVAADTIEWARFILTVCTLCLYFVSAIEAYLWLNPRQSERISGTTAVFRGTMLFIYLIAIILHAFLFQPLRNSDSSPTFVAKWCSALVSLFLVYALYNVVWACKRILIDTGKIFDDRECPYWSELAMYLAHYLFFAVSFCLLSHGITHNNHDTQVASAALAAILFATYLVTYFAIWWSKWHRGALTVKPGHLY